MRFLTASERNEKDSREWLSHLEDSSMADGNFVQIAPLMREPGVMEIKTPEKLPPERERRDDLRHGRRKHHGQVRARLAVRRSDFPGLRTAQHQAGRKSSAVSVAP